MAQPELARAYKMPSNIGKKKPFKVSDFLFKVSDSLRKRFFRGVNVNDVTVYPSRAPVFTQGVLAGPCLCLVPNVACVSGLSILDHLWVSVTFTITDIIYLDILFSCSVVLFEEFEDTKRVIRIRKSQKDRQHNGQKKKDKQLSTNHTHKTKDRVTRTPLKTKFCHIYLLL